MKHATKKKKKRLQMLVNYFVNRGFLLYSINKAN